MAIMMAPTTLEARLAQLEANVAKLQTEIEYLRSRSSKDWRRAVEKYADDEDLKSVLNDAQRLRHADRELHDPSADIPGETSR